jgi:hypothetical protein
MKSFDKRFGRTLANFVYGTENADANLLKQVKILRGWCLIGIYYLIVKLLSNGNYKVEEVEINNFIKSELTHIDYSSIIKIVCEAKKDLEINT